MNDTTSTLIDKLKAMVDEKKLSHRIKIWNGIEPVLLGRAMNEEKLNRISQNAIEAVYRKYDPHKKHGYLRGIIETYLNALTAGGASLPEVIRPLGNTGGATTSRLNPADMAKNHLARELGNQKRFLYEYGYSQIVDILEKAGFLKEPGHE